MRRGFTLIEMIFVILISALLAAGTFKALEALFLRSVKAKGITELSLESQIVLDQLSGLLYHRIPNSVIGYTPGDTCEPIDELSTSRPVLEWLGYDHDAMRMGYYDSFADMARSVGAPNFDLFVPSLNQAQLDAADLNLVFAGTFDAGDEGVSACNGAFGWHGGNSDISYDIAFNTPNNITLSDAVTPDYIYEKYYLTDTAYAVSRAENVNQSAPCISNLGLGTQLDNDTLLLFYNYRPSQGKTFCADTGGIGGATDGNVTVLAQDVTGFRVEHLNGTLRLSLDMTRNVRGLGSCDVHVSKQKVVF